MPKLSICISTLDRADFLKESIDSIISQKIESHDIEIVVSDGGSTDNTTEIMEAYVTEYDFIKYINPRRKVGLDEGYHMCVKESTGEYIWCMPDDDYFISDAFEKVLSLLETDLDLLVVNLKCFTDDLKVDLKQNLIPLTEDRIFNYEEFDNVFSEFIYGISYMGTLIPKRSIWFENNPEDYYESWFGAFAAMGESKQIRKISYLSEPIIHYRSACSCWTEHSFEIWYDIWPNLVNKFELFSKKINEEPVLLYPWLRALTLLKSRAMGEYNYSCYQKYIKNSPHASSLLRIKAFIISCIPVFLLNTAVLIALLVFKRNYLYSIYTIAMSAPNLTISNKIVKVLGIRF